MRIKNKIKKYVSLRYSRTELNSNDILLYKSAESRSGLLFVLHLRQKINNFIFSFFLVYNIKTYQVYIPVIHAILLVLMRFVIVQYYNIVALTTAQYD